MTSALALGASAGLLAPPPSPPCVPPELVSALADREFVFDGSLAWTAEHARRVLDANGGLTGAEGTLADLRSAARPVPPEWLGDRLTVLWTMFMASRTVVDEDALTVWLAEHMRLLGDLPHDIAARAIDRAVQSARHGFIPSVGEMRAIAEPLAAERERMIGRLRLVLETPETTR